MAMAFLIHVHLFWFVQILISLQLLIIFNSLICDLNMVPVIMNNIGSLRRILQILLPFVFCTLSSSKHTLICKALHVAHWVMIVIITRNDWSCLDICDKWTMTISRWYLGSSRAISWLWSFMIQMAIMSDLFGSILLSSLYMVVTIHIHETTMVWAPCVGAFFESMMVVHE